MNLISLNIKLYLVIIVLINCACANFIEQDETIDLNLNPKRPKDSLLYSRTVIKHLDSNNKIELWIKKLGTSYDSLYPKVVINNFEEKRLKFLYVFDYTESNVPFDIKEFNLYILSRYSKKELNSAAIEKEIFDFVSRFGQEKIVQIRNLEDYHNFLEAYPPKESNYPNFPTNDPNSYILKPTKRYFTNLRSENKILCWDERSGLRLFHIEMHKNELKKISAMNYGRIGYEKTKETVGRCEGVKESLWHRIFE